MNRTVLGRVVFVATSAVMKKRAPVTGIDSLSPVISQRAPVKFMVPMRRSSLALNPGVPRSRQSSTRARSVPAMAVPRLATFMRCSTSAS